MSDSKFESIITRALRNASPTIFDRSEAIIYKEFELAESRHQAGGANRTGDNLHFKFEKVRLGVAIALMQVFWEMSEDEDARQVLAALKQAAQATSVAQIDAVITKNIKAFDNLYKDLLINDEGEILLGLFERTLNADSKREIETIINETSKLFDHILE